MNTWPCSGRFFNRNRQRMRLYVARWSFFAPPISWLGGDCEIILRLLKKSRTPLKSSATDGRARLAILEFDALNDFFPLRQEAPAIRGPFSARLHSSPH